MPTSASKPSLALVGAGRWGKNLARNFFDLGVLHTICDASEALLDKFEGVYPGVALTSNFSSLLDNPAITRIAIAAPAAQHYNLAKQALMANKDVFVEKPLCLCQHEGEELIRLANERGCVLMVGHLLQYHPVVRRLQEMVGAGELGRLQYIVSNRLNLGSIRTEENALWSFAPHDISVILSLCGHRLPEDLRCTGAAYLSKGVADTTMTIMNFDGDVQAHIYVSWLNPFKEQKLVVIGSTGMAVFDDTKVWDEKLTLYRNHIKWTNGNIPEANKNEAEKVIVELKEPLREECLHFIKCCDERLTPRTDGKEGLRVLKVLQAAQESLNMKGELARPDRKEPAAISYFAHATAVVDPGAKVAAGAKIWHFSHIMNGAIVGPSCNIGQNVVISPDVTLGTNVKVQNNVSIYSGVTCEDNVFLGPSMVFTNVLNPRSAVNRRGQYEKTIVRHGASIGANATIVCGIEIGRFSFIGAGAVVTKSTKPFSLHVGNPARQIGWMSRHGERLDLPVSTSNEESIHARCPATKELYILTGNNLALEEDTVCEIEPAQETLATKA